MGGGATLMIEYTFYISYYSEATLKITIRRDSGYYEAECRHPLQDKGGRDIPLGGSWFFFSGPNWDNTEMYVRGEGIRDLLDHIAEMFHRGSAFYFEEEGDDTYYWFRQHLYIAFVFGHLPARDMRIPVVEEATARKQSKDL